MKKLIILTTLVSLMGCGDKNPTPKPGLPTNTGSQDTASYFYQNNVKVLSYLQQQPNSNLILASDFKSSSEYNVLQIGISAIPTTSKSFVIKYSIDSINERNVYMAVQMTKNGVSKFYTAMSGNGDLLRFEIDAQGRKVFKFDPFVCQNLSGSMYDTVRISGKLYLK